MESYRVDRTCCLYPRDPPPLGSGGPRCARGPPEPILSGQVPGLLAELTNALASPRAEHDQQARSGRSTPHPLAQTLREYHLLRRAIVSVLEAEQSLQPAERQIIDDAIDHATEGLGADIAFSQQQALTQTQAQYRLLVESARDFAIFSLNREGRVVTWNIGAERIMGYTPEEIIGQNGRILFTPEDRERGESERELKKALEEGRAEDERWHVRKDGSRFYASGVVVPLYDEEWRGYLKVMRDTTERQRMEEELQRRAEALAAADRQKNQFLTMLAHELRNPLAPMRFAVEILRRGQVSETALQRNLDIIERQVDLQARMLEDLLNVSRISRGAISLRPEPVDLAQLVQTAVEDHRQLLDAAGISLTLELPDQPVWSKADPARLRQVVGNLLHNAGKFTDRGGQVTVRLEARDSRAAVSVQDTGIGIPPELLPHIFKTFTQADRSLDRTRGGLGLGLALVKGLIELHGGEVRAESAGLGQGARISFVLPLAAAPEAASPPKEMVPAPPMFRLLVVEDNPDTASTLEELLELYGYQVEVAYSGPEALKIAQDFHPEVVLCDIGLPGMNGYRVAQALRAEPATASACLIAVSGYGQEDEQRQAHEAGFDAHVTKPVDFEALQRLLADRCSLRQER